MQFKIRAIATIVFAGLTLTLAGCSTNTPETAAPAPTPIVESSTTPAEPSAAPTITQKTLEDNKANAKTALDYLQSEGRSEKFKAVVPTAGKLIAKALEDRIYGPTKRYDDNKQPIAPGYVGWGGISSQNNQQFAWVFWNDGKIDYTKPITQIAIDYVAGDPATVVGSTDTGVSMLAPSSFDKKDALGSYWNVYLDTSSGETLVTSISDIEFPRTTPRNTDCDPGFRYPKNYNELLDIDTSALRTLDVNMTSHFGANWKDR